MKLSTIALSCHTVVAVLSGHETVKCSELWAEIVMLPSPICKVAFTHQLIVQPHTGVALNGQFMAIYGQMAL
jgi:hypothetical protein